MTNQISHFRKPWTTKKVLTVTKSIIIVTSFLSTWRLMKSVYSSTYCSCLPKSTTKTNYPSFWICINIKQDTPFFWPPSFTTSTSSCKTWLNYTASTLISIWNQLMGGSLFSSFSPLKVRSRLISSSSIPNLSILTSISRASMARLFSTWSTLSISI